LIFTGDRVDVGAIGQGLIQDIVPFDSLSAATMRLAERITTTSPISVREAKASIDASVGLPLEEGIAVEHESWARVVASDDRVEGIAAFNEKRPPKWDNR
jgi:enoyl-CoA hydratase/carnithine racemase